MKIFKMYAVVYRPDSSKPDFVLDSLHLKKEVAESRIKVIEFLKYTDLQIVEMNRREDIPSTWLDKFIKILTFGRL